MHCAGVNDLRQSSIKAHSVGVDAHIDPEVRIKQKRTAEAVPAKIIQFLLKSICTNKPFIHYSCCNLHSLAFLFIAHYKFADIFQGEVENIQR